MAEDPLHVWGSQIQGINRFYNGVHGRVDDNTHPLVLHLLTAAHVILEKAEADVAALRLGNLTAKEEAAMRAHEWPPRGGHQSSAHCERGRRQPGQTPSSPGRQSQSAPPAPGLERHGDARFQRGHLRFLPNRREGCRLSLARARSPCNFRI